MTSSDSVSRTGSLLDTGIDLSDGLLEYVHGLLDGLIGYVERAQAPHDGTVPASALHDQTVLEAQALDLRGYLSAGKGIPHEVRALAGIDELGTEHQSLSADIPDDGYIGFQGFHAGPYHLALAGDFREESGVGYGLHDLDARCHGHLVPAECAGVGTRAPFVQTLVVDDYGHGLRTAQGLGEEYHVGDYAGMLEGEHLAGTAHAALDLIADQRDVQLLGDPADLFEEFDGRGYDPSLSLDGLQDDGGGFRYPALGIPEQPLEVCDARLRARIPSEPHGAAVRVGVGHELHPGHGVRYVVLRSAVPGHRHRTMAHAVVSARECDYRAPARGRLAQLDGGIRGICAGGGAELYFGPGSEFRGQDRE